MLHNPVYAGYYAYGRRQVEPRRMIPGRPSIGRVVKDSTQWLVLLPGRVLAYISEEEYEANIARMAANRQTSATLGAPRDGLSLLSGLLRCGGHRMTSATTTYRGTRGHRTPTRAPSTRPATGPAAAASTSPALHSTTGSPARSWRRWRPPRWRFPWPPPRPRTSGPCWARYGASGSSAPATPLTGPPPVPAHRTGKPARHRQLEADWEAALAETARLEADYQRFTEEQPKTLTETQRTAIQSLARDLPQVWNAPSTTQVERKALLRILIEDITAAVIGDSELVDVTITWAGGHQTAGQAVRPVARLGQLSYYPALLARVTGLAGDGRNNRQIADVVNAEGFRPPKRTSRFTGGQVRSLITQHGIRSRPKGRPAVLISLTPGEWSVPSVASRVLLVAAGVSEPSRAPASPRLRRAGQI